jgi:hypothetical protein
MILLGMSAVTLVLVSIILIVVLHKSEDYAYGTIKDMSDNFKDKHILKRYTYGVQDPKRQQIVLKATIHPDAILRNQIEDNYGQLDRLKILMEEKMFKLNPNKEYHIEEIELRPPVDGNNFEVYGKGYPAYTYALLHFTRTDNKKQALIPLTDTSGFGAGSEELIYSMISDIFRNPNSQIKSVL